MIGSLSPDVQDVATLVVLLAPGFLFITVFQAVNVAYARNRSGWEWGMHSLVLSLPLFAAFNGIYTLFDWRRDPTDPAFYFGIFGGALVMGFVVGHVSRWPGARAIQRKFGFSDPKTTWADVVGQPESYIVVH